MKYLLKFNEELKSQTYLSASRKLSKLGHTRRSQVLKDWSKEVESKESMEKWKKNIDQYSKYGVFTYDLYNNESTDPVITEDFYVELSYMAECVEDDFLYAKENNRDPQDFFITFFLHLVPMSVESIEKIKINLPNWDFYNGSYQAAYIAIECKIVDGKISVSKFGVDSDEYRVEISNRRTANLLKRILSNFFSDSPISYPSGYNDITEMSDKIEDSLIRKMGLYDDYGFDLSKVENFIKSISVNSLFKN